MISSSDRGSSREVGILANSGVSVNVGSASAIRPLDVDSSIVILAPHAMSIGDRGSMMEVKDQRASSTSLSEPGIAGVSSRPISGSQ